jgi:2-isopropylmalate synthase
MSRFRDIGLGIDSKDPKLSALVELVKEREYEGYAYDGAEASFELLARRTLEGVDDYFRLDSFRITNERRCNAKGEIIALSEATTKIEVRGERIMTVAEGNGPVNALDAALRKALAPAFPELKDLRLVDYKVRILTPSDGTKAVTRVMIESADSKGSHWATVGVSTNVIEASFIALNDSIVYKLFRAGAKI